MLPQNFFKDHYIGFYKGFLDEINVWIGKEDYPSWHGCGCLTQSIEGLNETKTDLPWKKKSPSGSLWTQTATLPWVPSLPAYPTDFAILQNLNLLSLHIFVT